jgi:hypothetical protein
LKRSLAATARDAIAPQPLPVSGEGECEFCEPDGQGNHAPRCPVQLERELATEQAAHDQIASLCFAAGAESSDGTSVAAVKSVIALLATERAARERDIPTITNRTKNEAAQRIGEVLRHTDGPNSASHGCVEVTKVLSELEYWIGRAESAEAKAGDATKLREALATIEKHLTTGGPTASERVLAVLPIVRAALASVPAESNQDTEILNWMEQYEVSLNRLCESQTDLREYWHLYFSPIVGERYSTHTRHFGKLGQSLRDVINEARAAMSAGRPTT